MTSRERVLAACAFRRADRIPRFDSFWSYPDSWKAVLGPEENLTDVCILIPQEAAFPTRMRQLKQDGDWTYAVDPWGRTVRRKAGAYFVETLDVPIPPGSDVDLIRFDSPTMETRFLLDEPDLAAADKRVSQTRLRHCAFVKTGGPYLRSTFVRGEEQFLMDMAADESLARTIAEKVAAHITAVGVEALRRWELQSTGVWIYDDMACNQGPMFRRQTFEMVLLPAYRRMIKAYKDAGARYVLLHSDGDIRPLLDMLVDAGIDGINPMERRANMHPVELRKRYPRLVLTGGMDNTDTLINGPVARVEAETREIIDLGREGGVIIGTHSVSPEIPLRNFMAYHTTCTNYW